MSAEVKLSVNLERIASVVNGLLLALPVVFFLLGYFFSFYWNFLTAPFLFLLLVNFYYLYVQKKHALLTNFGLIAQARYIIESVGAEFRQYLYMSDTEERPFNRVERSELYRKAKNIDSSSAFGSLMSFTRGEMKLRHSMFPCGYDKVEKYRLVFGEERSLSKSFAISKPIIISAMSYGALNDHAVRALARGAKKVGIPMNTGEGGYPKYHLMESCDLIFQMGTAKFGVRDESGLLDYKKLEALAQHPHVKMIEIKLSQGAKPGKGGLLPKEKITEEIAELRGVPMGKDVLSPPYHEECTTPKNLVAFIRQVQEVSQLPVGIKLCLGNLKDFQETVREMKIQNTYPDYISVDGSEGGTGAAPKTFLDTVGLPLFQALPLVIECLESEGVRDRLKVLSAGKLVTAGKQLMALSAGADAVYTARGFMLSLGCIQALQCHSNTCPVGITTHNPKLKQGLDIEIKSERVKNYVLNLCHEHGELLSALGKRSYNELNPSDLFVVQ